MPAASPPSATQWHGGRLAACRHTGLTNARPIIFATNPSAGLLTIGNSVNLVLSGGSPQLGNFPEVLGNLQLGASSTIDFGATAATLVFADSHSSGC